MIVEMVGKRAGMMGEMGGLNGQRNDSVLAVVSQRSCLKRLH